MTGWQLNRKRWRHEYVDDRGRVLYWLSTEAVGTEFDSPDGFITAAGERIPPLPPGTPPDAGWQARTAVHGR